MDRPQLMWRKPSKPILSLMVGLFALWLAFAITLNWGGGSTLFKQLFAALRGDSAAVLQGQIWRLVTAAFIHTPAGPGAITHIFFVVLMLYFFVPALEEQWGTARLFKFMLGSVAFAYAVETLMFLALPTVAAAQWWGGMIMADAAVVAWAITNRGQIVRLFFVLPIKPMVMVGFMVVYHVLQFITLQRSPEGVFAPFAAMGAGYLFGGDSSPIRRAYLKFKLARLQREVDNLQKQGRKKKSSRAKASHLRVIDGGRSDDPPVLH